MSEFQAPLRVTEIAQFVKRNSCERWLRLAYDQREAAKKVPFYERLFNPLDPVLQQKGKMREDDWSQSLRSDGVMELTPPTGETLPTAEEAGPLATSDDRIKESGQDPGSSTDDNEDDDYLTWDEFRAVVQGLERGQESFAREVSITGEIGTFQIKGRIDFLIVRWGKNGATLRIVETKNSRKDRTSHRIQVALYEELIEEKLRSSPLRIHNGVITAEDIEGVVGRIDDTTNEIEDILALDALDLSRERSDAHRLLSEDGRIARILSVDEEDIDELDYRLEPKCDQCVFDVHCFSESARNRRLELLGIPPSTVRTIEDEEITSIDELATLDLDSEEAEAIRNDQSVREELSVLVSKARARVQRLPDTPDQDTPDVDDYPVQTLGNRNQSHLPTHEQNGSQIIRVYLNVDYDYVEDRIATLAAHITNSEWNFQTPFKEDGSGPDPNLVEMPPLNYDGEVQDGIDADPDDRRDVHGRSVVEIRTRDWSGSYERDTETESQLIEQFLQNLIDEIIEVSPTDNAYVHFYVWSQSEIDHLVDACSRGGTRLLNHLRQLLGCREPTEQLIYSSIRKEINNRYAIGWTGQGLSVMSSLSWFGNSYHWTRNVAGSERDFEEVFEQDIFDYKSTLGLNSDGTWAEDRDSAYQVSRFEIRSRFFDSLPIGYLHEVWGELPAIDELDGSTDNKAQSVIERYKRANRRDLKGYLKARTQALRWFDERIRPKNEDITKIELNLLELDQYDLRVHHTARAALDFLMLDHSVAMSQWYSDNMQALSSRVPQGLAIPLSNVRFSLPDGDYLIADLDFDDFGIGVEQFRRRTGFEPDDLVRIAPYSGDPEDGPTFGQLKNGSCAAAIDRYDWNNEEIRLVPRPWPGNRYRLASHPYGDPGDHLYNPDTDMVLVESISNHPAGHVDERLRSGRGGYIYDWFDPTAPDIPPIDPVPEGDGEVYEALLEDQIRFGDEDTLMPAQVNAILDSLNSRVHLIHGPPGTGKTTTTAMAILLRILHRREEGDRLVITGSTHQSVNTLLTRIQEYSELFAEAAEEFGFDMPSIDLVKVASSDPPNPSNAPGQGIPVFSAGSNYRRWNNRSDGNVLVIGGTVTAVLKDFNDIDDLPSVTSPYQVPELVVDEASMMVFPHFLAVSTIVEDSGYVLLAGDHRQLSPIVAHEWEEEDRPPVELYQPYSSAFEAVRDLERDERVTELELTGSALQHTFRLPPAIRALIRRLYQSMDELELHGEMAQEFETPDRTYENPFEAIWESDVGLFLIAHEERESRLSNDFEAQVARQILETGQNIPNDSVAVLTPHTAQRSNLELELGELTDGPVSVIDTVERLQGGEAETILVSATASDPTAIGSNEEFLLNLNRANVAFSRSQRRLIVICSKTFLDHIPPEIEEYNSAMLWKSLRNICTESVGSNEIIGHDVEVLIPDPDSEELQDVMEDNEAND